MPGWPRRSRCAAAGHGRPHRRGVHSPRRPSGRPRLDPGRADYRIHPNGAARRPAGHGAHRGAATAAGLGRARCSDSRSWGTTPAWSTTSGGCGPGRGTTSTSRWKRTTGW